MKRDAIASIALPAGDPMAHAGAEGRGTSPPTAAAPDAWRVIGTAVRSLGYPGVIGLGAALHVSMTHAGAPVTASAYLSVALGALAVMALERGFPHRRTWRATASTYRTDILYLVLVQMSLPVVLALLASLGLRSLVEHAPAGLWPHAWPLGVQAVLMIIIADGLRYWLHVAAHRYPTLWRLHAVHHSPGNLYWLNVARFHPLEKSLQYLLDTLPFVLVGVHQEVIALYLVFYALNGFLQHCNIELRLGWLNYVVSGPELHRWHHSRLPAESAVNFGNNLIIWDLLFGTRFLPEHRTVRDVGLLNRNYPESIGGQLKAPFVHGIDRHEADLPTWRELAINLLIHLRMLIMRLWTRRAFLVATSHPRRAQLKVLKRILSANRTSQFCKDHGVSADTRYRDFRRRVPIQNYETLRPYIDTHVRTGTAQLTSKAPLMYARTSGTTGVPKYVPVLPAALEDLRRAQTLATLAQYQAVSGAFAGRLLVIASPAVEGHLDNGTPVGSASGQILRAMPAIVRDKYVIPPEVFDIEDYDLKYQLILHMAVCEKNISAAGTSNPSTFLKLAAVLAQRRTEILRDIEYGTFGRLNELPRHVRDAVLPRLQCSESRLRELRCLLTGECPAFRDLWPRLRLVVTWTGGSCGIALDSVRAQLPATTRVMELGYISSEFRGTIVLKPDSASGVPTLHQNFFEFVEKQRWERGERQFCMLDELEIGSEYYVIVTTPSGLYRYFMNDIVRVTGRFRSTPTIEFLQKGRGVTNITGEKLYESQVIEAVKQAEKELGFTSRFFLMLADANQMVYRLLLEMPETASVDLDRIAGTVDRWLGRLNVEYAHKRASGRLNSVELLGLTPGSGEAHKRFCITHGQRDCQFKTLVLQYQHELSFPYRSFSLETQPKRERAC